MCRLRCVVVSLGSLERMEKVTYRLQTGVEGGTLHEQMWNENVRQDLNMFSVRDEIGESKDNW